jgi:colanic acid biosynthesis glycosyl transferase WcaI
MVEFGQGMKLPLRRIGPGCLGRSGVEGPPLARGVLDTLGRRLYPEGIGLVCKSRGDGASSLAPWQRPSATLCHLSIEPNMRIAVHDYCGHQPPFDLSRELARRGHEVRHYFFAEDIGPKGITRRLADDPENFSIEPISTGRPYTKQNLILRRHADILYGELASQRIASFAPDVTISGNTPLEAQAPIHETVRRAGSAFVFWMQDYYSLAAAKILGRKIPVLGQLIGAYYSRLEADMLRRSDGIVLITEDFRPALRHFGVKDGAADVIPNWGAIDRLPLCPKNNPWAKEHGLADKFVFLYSGTLAWKHQPDLLWTLAEHFQDDSNVAIAVVASGVSFDAQKARNAVEPKPNLLLLPLQPIESFPDVLGSGNVVVALLENDAGQFSVPSKVLSYLCCGRPILLSAPSDNLSVRLVEKAGAGVCVSAGDKEIFVAAADRLRSDQKLCAELGVAGRTYAENAFDLSLVADRFEAVFANALARRRSGG